MTTFHVRRASTSDAPAVADLNRHVHDIHVAAEPEQFHPTDRTEVERFFAAVLPQPEHIVFIAEGQEPFGYAWAQEINRPRTALTNERRVLYINHLAVAPSARRLRVATALCRAVEDEARSRRAHEVALDHWSFNEEAAVFFRAAGFTDFNVRMRKPMRSGHR